MRFPHTLELPSWSAFTDVWAIAVTQLRIASRAELVSNAIVLSPPPFALRGQVREHRNRILREQILTLRPSAQISLRRSAGGVFEIRVDGRLAYSKKATGRFPTSEEIAQSLS
jgi:selT/selW/selH-like putative selenoprotein